ncbi:20236_t:CDS:2 [Entrophospora sp. SA101]|nr:20236_t:CDS:2 [Entrophospora sp. SA101]CAJ0824363.1 6883_t:CDS:2 [Entrophospora sp. SA101]CAJ0847636.1 2840_t:CDS:2 [Entrophospora sp. SA101]
MLSEDDTKLTYGFADNGIDKEPNRKFDLRNDDVGLSEKEKAIINNPNVNTAEGKYYTAILLTVNEDLINTQIELTNDDLLEALKDFESAAARNIAAGNNRLVEDVAKELA